MPPPARQHEHVHAGSSRSTSAARPGSARCHRAELVGARLERLALRPVADDTARNTRPRRRSSASARAACRSLPRGRQPTLPITGPPFTRGLAVGDDTFEARRVDSVLDHADSGPRHSERDDGVRDGFAHRGHVGGKPVGDPLHRSCRGESNASMLRFATTTAGTPLAGRPTPRTDSGRTGSHGSRRRKRRTCPSSRRSRRLHWVIDPRRRAGRARQSERVDVRQELASRRKHAIWTSKRVRSMRRHISSRWRSAPPATKLPTTKGSHPLARAREPVTTPPRGSPASDRTRRPARRASGRATAGPKAEARALREAAAGSSNRDAPVTLTPGRVVTA